jgi:hypothetical protein
MPTSWSRHLCRDLTSLLVQLLGAGCNSNETAKRCPGQTENEYRTEFSLWTIAAAQMLVATDVRELTPFMKEMLL